MIYLDTSALVKGYLQEPGSDAVRRAAEEDSEIAFSILGVVEFASAVGRKAREEGRAPEEAASLIRNFMEDARSALVVPLVETNGEMVQEAQRVSVQHNLRAADSIHLATALTLARQTGGNVLFLSADRQLVATARGLGLEAQDPTAP